MKKIFIVLFVLLILGISGYFIYKYLAIPKVISSTSEPIVSCIDVDGNNIFEEGTTAYQYVGEGGRRTSEDFCDYYDERTNLRTGILRETYCLNGYLVTEKVKCGLGSVCRLGRCIKGSKTLPICYDSDGGINTKVKGEVSGNGSGMDSCYVYVQSPEIDGGLLETCSGEHCYIYEYFCDNDIRSWKIIPSPNGCRNGIEK